MFSFSGGYPSHGGVIFNANTGSNLDANQQFLIRPIFLPGGCHCTDLSIRWWGLPAR